MVSLRKWAGRHRRVYCAIAAVMLVMLSGCTTTRGGTPTSGTFASPAAVSPRSAMSEPIGASTASATAGQMVWVDQPVQFPVGGITIYATYRHPARTRGRLPAALLIAGSGPTDRNGDSAAETGSIGTLSAVAAWLSSDGVASLRYDKLGSGRTGAGPFAADPASVGIEPFEAESAAALKFLSVEPQVDPGKLAVIGHSEGALFALLLATGHAGPAPKIAALGLLEPLGVRYLDLISEQLDALVTMQEKSGQLSSALAAQVRQALTASTADIRAARPVPTGLPGGLSSILNIANEKFLRQADAFDPATLAAALPAGLPVLISCSNDDIQVSCADVDHLAVGLTHTDTTRVNLTGIDHVLKKDSTRTGAGYAKSLPFSTKLQAALATFTHHGW